MPKIRPVIHSTKHYVQTPLTSVASSAIIQIDLVKGITAGAVPASTAEVHEGNTVKAIFLEYWISTTGVDGTAIAGVLKLPGGLHAPTVSNFNNLQSYLNKKNIFELHEGLVPSEGNQIAVFRHWVKIPKGKQRIGLGDEITFNLSAVGTAVQVCGFSTYKDYS